MKGKPQRNLLIIGAGFLFLVLIICAQIFNTSIQVDGIKSRIDTIISDLRVKKTLIYSMREDIHKRQVILHKIVTLSDIIARDMERTRFYEHAQDVLMAREAFQAMKLTEQETAKLNDIKQAMRQANPIQNEIINLAMDEASFSSLEGLFNQVFPHVARVKILLDDMVAIQESAMMQAYGSTNSYAKRMRRINYMFGGGALFVGLLIAVYVLNVTKRQSQHISRTLDQLQYARDTLEVRVKTRTKELVTARDEAQVANAAKSQFLANMSHELRTPLTAVIGYSELLVEEVAENGDSKYLQSLKCIHSAGLQQLDLINTILDLTKIESGQLELDSKLVDIYTLVMDTTKTIYPLTNSNNNVLSVICDEDIGSIYTDEVYLKQLLLNILENANKFTQKGSILFSIKQVERELDNWMVFEVTDTGIGIEDEHIALLFQAFSQADYSDTREYGGAGIGLSISNRICHMMGGRINVKSTLGDGSTFTIEIPMGHTIPGVATLSN